MNASGFLIYLPDHRMMHVPARVSKLAYWHGFYIVDYTFQEDDENRRDKLILNETDEAAVRAFARDNNVTVPFERDGHTVVGWDPHCHTHRLKHSETPSPTASPTVLGEISRVI
jgi:hypothetical protein